MLLVEANRARELGLKPLARVVSTAVAGIDPAIMGAGPIPAVRKALARAGLTPADLDLVELNEAFASQSVVCIDELGLDPERVNVNGGAIALGHPLGMSGGRLVTMLVHELRARGGRYGLATMCIGVGQGIASVIERIDGAAPARAGPASATAGRTDPGGRFDQDGRLASIARSACSRAISRVVSVAVAADTVRTLTGASIASSQTLQSIAIRSATWRAWRSVVSGMRTWNRASPVRVTRSVSRIPRWIAWAIGVATRLSQRAGSGVLPAVAEITITAAGRR